MPQNNIESFISIKGIADDNLNIHSEGPQDGSNEEEIKKDRDYYNFGFAAGVFNRLIGNWLTIAAETDRQRMLRYVKDAESIDLREAGIIKADEVYTPVRLIDSNIRAEQPALVQYITQSRRSIIFAPPNSTPIDGLEKLEADFTIKARYLGWELAFISCVDGSQAHAWDAIETIFDVDYPGNFCNEHIGHDRLIFSIDTEDIEAQEVIAIQKMLTANQLRALVEEGFNKDQVEKLINTNTQDIGSSDNQDNNKQCFKIYFKQDGIVHTAWFAKCCDGFLMNPEPLFMGMRDFSKPPVSPRPQGGGVVTSPESLGLSSFDSSSQPPSGPAAGPEEGVVNNNNSIPSNTNDVDGSALIAPPQTSSPADYPPIYETEYPITILPYIQSSDPRIVELMGRCKLDEPSQEAASALQSGMVNGTMRAANIFGSPQGTNLDANPSDLPILTDIVLGNGRLFSKPMNFWHTPYPDSSVVNFLQTVVTQNKQEQGQGIDFSVLNRKDSGKTATEIDAASAKSAELGSVQVILLSIFVRKVYAKCWRIYQNRVLQGKIIIKDVQLLQLFGDNIQVDPQTSRVTACSEAIDYIIKSSGDIDVVQRQEKLQRLMQGWEVFGKTPLASEYLKDIVRYSFPEDASRYVAILEQGEQSEVNNLKQILQQTAMALQAVIIDPQTKQLIPAAQPHQKELQQLAAMIQQALAAPSGTQAQVQQPQQ